jgi:WXG100 family type VII secretion target
MAVNSGSASGMKQACGQFESASSSATSQLERVNSEMASLQASWTGDASVKFGQAMNDWEQQFGVIIKELNRMIEIMGGSGANELTAVDSASAWAGGLAGH